MRRVVVLGLGATGKTTLAVELGHRLGVPVVELDKEFWGSRLEPTPRDQWRVRQRELVQGATWVLDGDLGPYDDLAPRLSRADTVVVLDLARCLCAWRAVRRSRTRRDFWRWPSEGRPAVLAAVAHDAPDAVLVVLHSPRSVRSWLDGVPAP